MVLLKVLVIGYMHSKYDKRVHRTVEALSRRCEVIYQYLSSEEEPSEEESIRYIPIKHVLDHNIVKELIKRRALDRKICHLVEYEDYDILYLHHFPTTKPAEPFKIARRRKKKVVYDIHEYHPQNFLANLPSPLRQMKEHIMWRIFRKQLELSDRWIFVSRETAEDIIENISFKKPHLVVPNYASF